MARTLREFIDNLVVESLHPELHQIVRTKPRGSKQTLLANKIKDLTVRGETTGIEGKMPKGSSRAYLPLKDRENVMIDGRPASIKTGMKVAIRAGLDRYHKAEDHDGMSLGNLQNEAEGGDGFINSQYRILTRKDDNNFETNTESGIFPPLIDHDHDGHEWTHVGHADKVTGKQFRALTRTESHPKGISHSEFCEALERVWNEDHGKHWHRGEEKEAAMDHIEEHPLVQKFIDHQRMYGAPPHDYRQLGNMGIWTHPHTGEQHIVARDHGYSESVQKAYGAARKRMTDRKYGDQRQDMLNRRF